MCIISLQSYKFAVYIINFVLKSFDIDLNLLSVQSLTMSNFQFYNIRIQTVVRSTYLQLVVNDKHRGSQHSLVFCSDKKFVTAIVS